jgi:glycosyltransferase involved in cell wall biosynthesis
MSSQEPREKLRVAVMLGKLGAAVHGKLDAARAFDDGDEVRGSFMTGTVAGFLTIAWGLAERGHEVDAFCDAKETVKNCASLGGACVYPIDEAQPDDTYDTYISVLEPDLLRSAPASKVKVLVQWLNDFSYCKRPGWEEHVDAYVSPSMTHGLHLSKKTGVPSNKIFTIPLAVNPELHGPTGPRRPLSIAYASSPDRGLHHLLEWFPEIRRRVPGAELRVYYRVKPWMEEILREPGLRGSKHWKRAKAVKEAFESQGANGENGLYLVGPLPQRALAQELGKTMVLAYPCDPVKFTEGFSMTVLDACAAGCVPIVAGVDALTELWWNAAVVIPGNPSESNKDNWIDTIVFALTDDTYASSASMAAKSRARELTRMKVAEVWEKFLKDQISKKPSSYISDSELRSLVGQ